MTEEETLARAREAQGLLDNAIIQNFTNDFNQVVFEKWKKSTEIAERERWYMLTVAADAFRQQLVTYINNGKLAKKNLEEYANGN